MSNPIILPPLPEPAGTLVPPAMTAGSSWYSHGYTADQLLAARRPETIKDSR